jgi:hypothetical protein
MKGIFANPSDAVNHVLSSFKNAREYNSNLSDGSPASEAILGMFGMSGKKWRHFLNNIINFENLRYSEVGAHVGSTFCAAIYKNSKINFASTMDNFTQFADDKTKEFLINNVSAVAVESGFIKEENKLAIFEQDFNKFDFANLNPIDVYFFDGPHDEESQKQGIVRVFDSLADTSIILVDDWNWGGPKRGTFAALEEIPADINYQCEIFTAPEGHVEKDGKMIFNRFGESDWHNGVSVFVITKNN